MADVFLSCDDSEYNSSGAEMIEWREWAPGSGNNHTVMLTIQRAIARLIDRVIHNRRLIDQLYVDRDELRTLVAEQRQMIFELRRKLEDRKDGPEGAQT